MGASFWVISVLFLLYFQLDSQRDLFASGCQTAERVALLELKDSLEDPSNRLSSWIGLDCCRWDGVRCDNATGHIHHLDLRNPHYDAYTGEFDASSELRGQKLLGPSLVDQLTQLRYLDLSGNNFLGNPIPKFIASFKHLRYLNISFAKFTGVVPPQLGNLTRLVTLDLSSSNSVHLYSCDLSWVSGLSRLRYLNMGGLNFTLAEGSLHALNNLPSLSDLRLSGCSYSNPHSLFRALRNSTWLTTIEHLDLSQSGFQGPPPHFLANMTSLTFLNLSSNQFNGSIPYWLENMSGLESLSLSLNSFSHIDGGSIRGFLRGLCKLKVLDLSGNQIQGKVAIPYENSSKCVKYDLEDLDLSMNNFMGNLPSWLGDLESLRNLVLGTNKFRGKVPLAIGNLSLLETLDLSHNKLHGPIPLVTGGLKVLQVLHLSYNKFRDQIPPWIGGSKGLKLLDLSNNRLDGQIPPWIGGLKGLQVLYLSSNRFSGHIPKSLGQWKSLTDVDLSSNLLEGVVSDYHLANLSSLVNLDLSSNSLLDLNFSSDWIPPFQLSSFQMSNCKIQSQLPLWIQSQKNLQFLYLSNNQIFGMMLDWSRCLHLKVLSLSNNSIVGPITQFPPLISYIDLSSNKLSGPLSQNLSKVNGEVRQSLCRLWNLGTLLLHDNMLFGEIPKGCWANSSFLKYIDLSFNKLSGHIPVSIGRLPSLRHLKLSSNLFQGKVPATLSNNMQLEILDLGENKLSGEVPSFMTDDYGPNLQLLRLRGNQLTGVIPKGLCSQKELNILDLAGNNLTGNIPHCFGNLFAGRGIINVFDGEHVEEVLKGEEYLYSGRVLSYVVNLDLSCNDLVGSIPEEISNLSSLIGLNLSYNHLTGRIPENIGQMTHLESLDLSNNNISGTIPESISRLTFLSHLNLSHNMLRGEIPTGQQLQTLNDPSIYASNPGLCGDPLPNKCTGDDNQQHDKGKGEQEEENDNNLEKVMFYLVVALGFGTGFWGVVGTLLLKRQCRYAVFRRVEDIVDYLYVQVAVRINRLRH